MPSKSATTPSNRPVWAQKLKGVHVAVFRNVSEKDGSVFYKTSLSRVYKNQETGEFSTTSSLSREDLCVAQLLLGRAYAFILEAESNRGEAQE